MSGTDTAAMVPNKYDVVIDGYGYMFWAGLMQSLPFRNQRAAYSYTPTFIPRTNISGAYGDNQQDFFLTASQDNWFLGQGQRFFRANDQDSSRKYYSGASVDTNIEGQVTMRRAIVTSTLAANVKAACPGGYTLGPSAHAYCTTSNLYTVDYAGAITDQGAHGAGTPRGMCTDGVNLYVSGSSKVRKWTGSGYSDFSASLTGEVAFLNNSLYGFLNGVLHVYDTSGTQSTVFTWKDATGTTRAATAKIMPFGGQLLIYFPYLTDRPELWIYDGTGTSRIAELPASAVGYDLEVIEGVVYLSGAVCDAPGGSTLGMVPVVWAYVNGSISEVWRAQNGSGTLPAVNSLYLPALGTYAGRLIFVDPINQSINEYNPANGAVSVIAQHTREGSPSSTTKSWITSAANSVFLTYDAGGGSPKAVFYPDQSNFAATATLDSSLIDFDNSLTKLFRGIKVDWEGGGSVDLWYQSDSLTSGYTPMSIGGARSGTEYLFTNLTGRSMSWRLVLNNNVSGADAFNPPGLPTIKRVYLRAVPVQQSYKRRQYVLDLSGVITAGTVDNPVPLRDSTSHVLTGAAMAANLNATIVATSPFNVTDRLGTYSAVFEQGEGITEIDEVRPGEFIAQVTLREA